MNKLLTITFYKLKIMFSDKLFFSLMVIIPIFIIIATGYALRYQKLNIIPVGVVDNDQSETSKILIERFSKIEGFEAQRYLTQDDGINQIKDNKIEALFIIKSGFEKRLEACDDNEVIDLIKDPSSASVSFIGEVFAGEVMRLTANNYAYNTIKGEYEKFNKKMEEGYRNKVIKYIDSLWEPTPLMTIRYEEVNNGVKKIKRPDMPVPTATSAGIIIVFIMFYILFGSSWLIEERINGTLKRLVSIHNGLGMTFTANILALFLGGIAQVVIFAGILKIFFNIDLFTNVWSFVIVCFYLLAVIAVTFFLSSILNTPAQLQAGAPVFALLTSFVGGCFWNFVDISN